MAMSTAALYSMCFCICNITKLVTIIMRDVIPHQILLSPDDLPVDHPVKSLGRRNSNDVCTPCRDFITTTGGAKCYQVIIMCCNGGICEGIEVISHCNEL